MPRFRIRTRTLLLLVALVAVGLFVARVVQDGVRTHWLVLQLRYGDSQTRLAVAKEIWSDVFGVAFSQMFSKPRADEVNTEMLKRASRRTELLAPALIEASHDPAPDCRASTLKSLSTLVVYYGSETTRELALACITAATRDTHEDVRAVAAGSLIGLDPANPGRLLDLLEQFSLQDSTERLSGKASGPYDS